MGGQITTAHLDHPGWHDPLMPKPTYVSKVTVLDGRS
jgi:hypothetical protein